MNIQRILVDLDPRIQQQPGLTKSICLAKQLSAELELFTVAYNRGIVSHWFIDEEFLTRAKSSFIEVKRQWLDNYVRDVASQDIKVSAAVEWGSVPAVEIIEKAKNSQVDLIIKSTHRHPKIRHFLFTATDWLLIRKTPLPILFAKEASCDSYKNVMAAVDLGNESQAPSELNQLILSMSHYFATHCSANQYIAHCYEAVSHELMTNLSVSMQGVGITHEDRGSYLAKLKAHHKNLLQQLISQLKIQTIEPIVEQGKPDDVLPMLVEKKNVDLLVLGAASHFSFFGGTAERLLDELPCDLLVIGNG